MKPDALSVNLCFLSVDADGCVMSYRLSSWQREELAITSHYYTGELI